MEKHIFYIVFIHCFVLFKFSNCATLEYAVLISKSLDNEESFCIMYFKDFSTLPATKSDEEIHIFQDESENDWCDENLESDIKDKVVLISLGNCSISTYALNIFNSGGKGVLFTATRETGELSVNASDAKGVNLSVALINKKDAETLKKMHPSGTVYLLAPTKGKFDISLLLIFIYAMFSVTIGSYWSGIVRFETYTKEVKSEPDAAEQHLNGPPITEITNEKSTANASAIVGLVIFMTVMLLLMYFFIDYVVYFLIGLFVLTCIFAVHNCLVHLGLKMKLALCRAQLQCCAKTCYIDFFKILLLVFSIAVCVYWLIVRKENYAWILQNLLGVAACIYLLKSLRLTSFKIGTILLVSVFVYDIFFVFITQYLTEGGKSVMEEVVTGGKTNEMIPMILIVPHLGYNPLSVCYYSILGYGDLLLPGLLVSYCFGFDLITNSKRIYFITTIITYGLGLIIAFGASFLMGMGQPALLYLVPCTVLPPALLGLCRKELPLLWRGHKDKNDAFSTAVIKKSFTKEGCIEQNAQFLSLFTYEPEGTENKTTDPDAQGENISLENV